MNIVAILAGFIYFLNMLFAVILIFRERRSAGSSWAWLLVLFFIPLLGFLLYLLFGQNLSRYHMFQWEGRKRLGIEKILSEQVEQIQNDTFAYSNRTARDYRQLMYMHLINNDAVLTENNEVDVMTDGKEKFEKLLDDIEHAKNHIHLQYYILKRDQVRKAACCGVNEKGEARS